VFSESRTNTDEPSQHSTRYLTSTSHSVTADITCPSPHPKPEIQNMPAGSVQDQSMWDESERASGHEGRAPAAVVLLHFWGSKSQWQVRSVGSWVPKWRTARARNCPFPDVILDEKTIPHAPPPSPAEGDYVITPLNSLTDFISLNVTNLFITH
jgi:hypothetical protein